jgi:hypothetical protein
MPGGDARQERSTTDEEESMTDDDDAQFDEMTQTEPSDVEYMFAQTAKGLSVNLDGRITLKGVSGTTLFFSDRPYRLTGHIHTDQFVASWSDGDDNFAENPPNALLSIFEEDAVNDVVVILTDPKLSNGDLSYAVDVSDGDLSPSEGPASLFIDMIGRPLSPMSVAGVHRRGRRRGRRRVMR